MSSSVAPSTLNGEQRFVLHHVGWDFYLRCGEEIGEQPSPRLSFSDGRLEFMVTGSTHEYFKKILAKLVEMVLFEMNLPVRSGGSFTIQREDLEKGFEPDECWWIASEPEMRGKEDVDFTVDPPPDLAIEVEISTSLVNRSYGGSMAGGCVFAVSQAAVLIKNDRTAMHFHS